MLAAGNKLRLLLLPFFATTHMGPFADLAVRLTTPSSDAAAVQATVTVTTANLPLLDGGRGIGDGMERGHRARPWKPSPIEGIP